MISYDPQKVVTSAIANKPVIGTHTVFATDKGWCIEHCDGGEPEVIYECFKLLNLLKKQGYDQFGVKVESTGTTEAPEAPQIDVVEAVTEPDTNTESVDTVESDLPGETETDSEDAPAQEIIVPQESLEFNPQNPKTFTQEGLMSMGLPELKKLGEMLNVKGSTKEVLTKRILEKVGK